MKLTSIPFCKELPDNWQEIPNKYLFEYHSSQVGDNWKNYQLLSLTTSGVKEKDINSGGGKVPDSYDKYQTVEPGDIVFCLFDLDVSAVFSGLSHNYGMITSAYDVVRAHDSLLDQSYCDFWFQYVFSNRYYKMYSKNIRYTIGTDMFKSIKTPVPPIEVQKRIGAFLNKKTSEIDSLIEIEETQIANLQDYKVSTIGEYIRGGLDKNALKISSNGWFPIISQKAKITSVGHLYEIVLGKMISSNKKEDDETLEPYYCAANVHFDSLDDSALKSMWFSPSEKETYAVKHDDLLIVEGGAGAGGAHMLSNPKEAYVQNSIMIARGGSYHKNKWLYYNLYYLVKNGFIDFVCNKATIPHFTKEKLQSTEITILPQDDIVAVVQKLDALCSDIDKLIEIKRKKIKTLIDYKKSLIYECITGKKEVMA